MVNQQQIEGMLSPYRILDLTNERGLYCGHLFGSLGADVIKVEKPGGDPIRSLGPFYHNIIDPNKSLFWLAYNTNKRSITLNIDTVDGKEIFKKLVETADVIIESFPPGYMDKSGLGYSELTKINPGIIMTSITPFGQLGPYKDYKASDLVCLAMGGLLYITGDLDQPPVCVNHIPFAFLLASMDGAWSTMIALYWRAQSREGQHIDISIRESVLKTVFGFRETWEVTGQEHPRQSSSFTAPNSDVTVRLVWPTKDGYVMYMMYTGHFGAAENKRLVKWLDDEGMADDFIKGVDWPNLDWRQTSPVKVKRIQDYIANLFQSKTTTEIVGESLKRDVMVQPISAPNDLLEHPQLEARDYWQNLYHDDLDTILRYPSRFCLLSETTSKIWRRAPLIGEHNQEIYHKELGLSKEDVIILKQAGAI